MSAPSYVVHVTGRPAEYLAASAVEALAWAAAFCPVGGGAYATLLGQPVFGCYREGCSTKWTLTADAQVLEAFRMLPAGNLYTNDSTKPS